MPKDGSDIHRFSNRKWVSVMCKVGNLEISEAYWNNSNVVRLVLTAGIVVSYPEIGDANFKHP